MRKRLNHLVVTEQLEHRRLFSALDDLRGVTADLVDAAAPSLTARPDAVRTRMRVDADLRWLANNAPDADRPALDKADSALLSLYSRARRGLAASALGQLVDGADVSRTHIVRNDGVPLVHLTVTDVAAVRPRVEALGIQVADVVDRPGWQLIDAYVPIGRLLDVTNLPGVKSARAQRRPETHAAGAWSNEWEASSGVAQYRTLFPGVDGSGTDFGVLSDSMDKVNGGLAASQATGDLPGGSRVTVLDEGNNSDDKDEGRAMAELIIDVAPAADIIFHTAHGGINKLANSIDDLRQAGADVIVDDVTYYEEPAFQDGPVAQAVDDVVTDHDVLYFSSAGNYNNQSALDTWSDPDGDSFHNFDSGSEIVPIRLQANVDVSFYLQFDDPWGNAGANYEIRVYDFDGGVVGDQVAASNDDNTLPLGGNPFDDVTIRNNDDRSHDYAVSIRHLSGNAPSGQRLFLYHGNSSNSNRPVAHLGTDMANEPSVFGHHNARRAFSIGAVASGGNTVESFSSRGGVPIVFKVNGDPFDGPNVRDTPTFVADDQVTTSLARFRPFGGTSAAAPNAAAVAGLMLEVNGGARSLTFDEFRDLAVASVEDLGVPGYDPVYGHGRIEGMGALFATKGPNFVENVLELNQFGNANATSFTLNSLADVDGFDFATDADGPAFVTVQNPLPTFNLDPALALFDRSSGAMVDYAEDNVASPLPTLFFEADARNRYSVEVFNQTTPSSTVMEYTLHVNAPSPEVDDLVLDHNGIEFIHTQEIGQDDSDYFRLKVPGTVAASGEVVITLDPAATLDAVVTVFDEAGDRVRRRDAAGADGVETITLEGVRPNAEYVIRVAGSDYNTQGAYFLTVDVDVDLPPTLPAEDALGTVIFDRSGVADDAADRDLFLSSPGETDSFVFAGNAGWDGEYRVTVTAPLFDRDVVPAVGIYDGATGALLAFGRPSNLIGAVTLTLDGVGLKKYVLAVADAGNTDTGDLSFRVTAPGSNTGQRLNPDVQGDAYNDTESLSPQADSDFYSFTVPAGVTGGRVELEPQDGALDGVIGLFDDAGGFLGAVGEAGPGGEEAYALSGLEPGGTYRLTVLPERHDSAGAYVVRLDLDVPVGSVAGVVFEDLNADGVGRQGEPGLGGWRVYADLNGNGVFDATTGGRKEPFGLTDLSGAYRIDGVPLGNWHVRQEFQPDWVQSRPQAGEVYEVAVDAAGKVITGLNFGNFRFAAQRVRSWLDSNGNGTFDAGENPLSNRQVFADYDDDRALDANEPWGVTNVNGQAMIVGIVPGTWPVRELMPPVPGWVRTYPNDGSHEVTLASGQAGGDVRFGSLRVLDFGDAPDSYGTTLANNGARHFARSPWYLGREPDWEFDGVPTPGAGGDDATGPAPSGDDEDGIKFVDPLVPGRTARIEVRASRRGRLNGWIDLNADGDFLDPVDFVMPDALVPAGGVRTFTLAVPAGAVLGDTYARFRFNAVGGIGPVGLGLAGEVEDYAVKVVPPPPLSASEAPATPLATAPAPLSLATAAPPESAAPPTGSLLMRQDPDVILAVRRARRGLFAE